jgi:adenosine deaminase
MASPARHSFLIATLCAATAHVAAAQPSGEAAMSARFTAARQDSTALLALLRAMPKGGDLHNHLSGAVQAESWAQWAAEDGLCYVVSTSSLTRPPCDGSERVPATQLLSDSALLARAVDAWSMRHWRPEIESGADHFFATFGKTAAVGITHLGDMLAEVTSHAAAQHVSYLELMSNGDDGAIPRLGLHVGWTNDFAALRARLDAAGMRDSLRAATRTLDRAEQRQRERLRCGTPSADAGCDVTVRYIYQVVRSRRPEQVFAQLLAGLELPSIDRRYVSLNLVAPEHGEVALRDFALHMRMIEWLRRAYPSVPITLHAGELSDRVAPASAMQSHIRHSVEVAGASRIGHGVDVLQEADPESLLREMATRHVLVEIGLSSNDLILGVQGVSHPLSAYLSHGVPVALVTDDEGISRSDMTHEYLHAVIDQHLDYRALKTMARNSIAYSFADDSTKSRLRSALDTAFAAFESQRPRTLPDSLTDREFWQLFTTLSEDAGTFPSENFVSNEKTFQYVIPTLQRTLTPRGVYLGVGPEQNFTYIANLEPRLAVIIDIRRQNAMLHLMYKALFELSASRAEFVSRLFSRPLPVALTRNATPDAIFAAAAAVANASDSAFDANWKAIVARLTVTHGFALADSDLASIRHVFAAFREAGPDISYAYHLGAPPSPTAWLVTFAQLQTLTNADSVNMAFLATEDRYRRVRAMEVRNLVVPVVGDFGGPKAIRRIGEYVAARGAIVTAFYVSNVEQYLFGPLDASGRFYRNVEALPIDSTSAFIRSLPAPSPSGLPLPLPPLPRQASVRSVQIIDSSGVRIMLATVVDSSGTPVTTRMVIAPATPAVSSTGAFISGIAPMRATLRAFADGQLRTYTQLGAMTKTDGWK